MTVAKRRRNSSPEDAGAMSRKLVAAMILTGGLLTLASFAKYVDHGRLVSDIVSRVQQLTAW
jgi:hypothetical protein